MNEVQFCYWLQGYIELSSIEDKKSGLSHEQLESIKRHLNLVFECKTNPSINPTIVSWQNIAHTC